MPPHATAPQAATPHANGVEPPRVEPLPANDEAIVDLKRKLDELQGQLAELSKKP